MARNRGCSGSTRFYRSRIRIAPSAWLHLFAGCASLLNLPAFTLPQPPVAQWSFDDATGLEWKDHESSPNSRTRIMLHGLTESGPAQLAQLGRSWLHAPVAIADNGAVVDIHYDEAERGTAKGVRLIRNVSIFRIHGAHSEACLPLIHDFRHLGENVPPRIKAMPRP